MSERLTEYFECGAYTEKKNIVDVSDKIKFFDNGCVMGKAIDKLARVEDIMERLGINFIEDLEDEINSLRIDKYVYKKARDNWKKTCEFLSNKYAEEYFDGRDIEHCFNADKRDKFVKEKIEYFYQQAKKEGNDE